jgi:hypothetical protein
MLDRYSRASENDISLLTELMVDGLQCYKYPAPMEPQPIILEDPRPSAHQAAKPHQSHSATALTLRAALIRLG